MQTPTTTAARHPVCALDETDQEFVLRFVLASGSLKDVARGYGVSYPTIRARLDRLITRLQALAANRRPDPMDGLLADLVERGELSTAAARALRDLHRQQLERKGE